MNNNIKKSFVLYIDYRKHLDLLNFEERGELLTAIYDYVESMTLPNFEGGLKMAFSFISSQLDRDIELYEKKCRKNAQNGALGGRPPTEQNQLVNPITERLFQKPKKADNDTDNANENINVNEIHIHTLPTNSKTTHNINYKNVVDLFNTICLSLPKVKTITVGRQKAIKAVYADVEAAGSFKLFFEKVENSDFLCGRADKTWQCNFDWILKKANTVKIIEDTYINHLSSSRQCETRKGPDYSDISRYENTSMEV